MALWISASIGSNSGAEMRLASAPKEYDSSSEQALRNEVLKADLENWKRGRDIELARGDRVILRSPNGTRYAITVSNAGALSTVAV